MRFGSAVSRISFAKRFFRCQPGVWLEINYLTFSTTAIDRCEQRKKPLSVLDLRQLRVPNVPDQYSRGRYFPHFLVGVAQTVRDDLTG